MSSPLSKAALVSGFAAIAAAHGTVSGIVADGNFATGYSPSMQYQKPPPTVVGWSIPQDQDNGFVAPDAFGNPDIICHKGATNAGTHASVAAGGTVKLQWTTWPESHKGPVIDYLANCNGPCESVDKTKLEFFKIDGVGITDGSTTPPKFASDKLVANNNSWTVTIPSSIKAGNYVLRHEIIALHSAGQDNGAQAYPQCVNLEVTGGGSDTPAGTLGTALYKATDPGIKISIYHQMSASQYIVPGPPLYGAGSSGNSSAGSGSGSGSAGSGSGSTGSGSGSSGSGSGSSGSGSGSSGSGSGSTGSGSGSTGSGSGSTGSGSGSSGSGSGSAGSSSGGAGSASSSLVTSATSSATASSQPSQKSKSSGKKHSSTSTSVTSTAKPTSSPEAPFESVQDFPAAPTSFPSFGAPDGPVPSGEQGFGENDSGENDSGKKGSSKKDSEKGSAGQNGFGGDSSEKATDGWYKKRADHKQRRHARDVLAA